MAVIDPVQFGRLLASVDNLTETLGETQEAMQALNTRIVELESRYTFGKAALTGLIIGAGFAVKGFKTLTGLTQVSLTPRDLLKLEGVNADLMRVVKHAADMIPLMVIEGVRTRERCRVVRRRTHEAGQAGDVDAQLETLRRTGRRCRTDAAGLERPQSVPRRRGRHVCSRATHRR